MSFFNAKNIGKSEGNKWLFLSLAMILLVIIVLCFGNISYDIIGLKENQTTLYKVVWFSLAFMPLFILPFFSYWKTLVLYEKVLIIALAAFLIAINHKYSYAFLFSALFAGAVGVYFYHNKTIYRPNLFYILLIVYVLINAVSLSWSRNLTLGLQHLEHLSPLLYIPVLFCFFKLNSRQFDLVALFVFRATLFYAIYSICSWAIESRFLEYPLENSFTLGKYSINGISPFNVVYAWTNHMHPTYNGVSLIFALGIGWYYVRKKDVRDNISYFELLFFVLVTFLLSILTASRFMLVIWLLVNYFGVILFIYKDKVLMVITSLLSLALMLFVLFSYSDEIGDFIHDPARMALYNAGIDGIKDNTWRGVGLGAMTDYINKDNPNFAYLGLGPDDHLVHLHPHNQFIGDWMQTGIFGFLTILGIIIVLLYSSVVRWDWLLWISWLVYVLLMCIEMPLIYPNGIFFFALVFSFLIQKDWKPIALFNFAR